MLCNDVWKRNWMKWCLKKEFGWNGVWKSWHGCKCWNGGMAEWNVWMDVALKKMLVNEWCCTKLKWNKSKRMMCGW